MIVRVNGLKRCLASDREVISSAGVKFGISRKLMHIIKYISQRFLHFTGQFEHFEQPIRKITQRFYHLITFDGFKSC